MLTVWEKQTEWSKPQLTGAFTLALLATALSSPIAGHFVDRGRGHLAQILALVGAIAGLIVLAASYTLAQFYLAWLIIGLSLGACLYETTFAQITRAYGIAARKIITRITLIAGFAGTLSFPVANLLAASLGWRGAVLFAALSILVIGIPLTLLGGKNLPEAEPDGISPDTTNETASTAGSRKFFWLIATGFTLVTITQAMVITHLLPLLAERSIPLETAVLAAATIGPMQVVGRIAMMSTEQRISTFQFTGFCFTGVAFAAFLLLIAGANTTLVMLFVAVHGASWGTLSILRPALTREVLGPGAFGLNSGRISGLGWLGSAGAPFGGSLLWLLGGYQLMLAVCVIMSLIAVATLIGLRSAPARLSPKE